MKDYVATGNYYATVYFCNMGNSMNVHWWDDNSDGRWNPGYMESYIIETDVDGKFLPARLVKDEDLAEKDLKACGYSHDRIHPNLDD